MKDLLSRSKTERCKALLTVLYRIEFPIHYKRWQRRGEGTDWDGGGGVKPYGRNGALSDPPSGPHGNEQ